MSNALKFTEHGEIEFGYKLKNEMLEFFVKDSGVGIDKNKQEEIFERFRQAKHEDAQKFGGTGLGLAICKGIVELLGGEIWVNSEVGKGSEFVFTIPFVPIGVDQIAEHRELSSDELSALLGMKLLVVDDNHNILHFYKETLESYGIKVTLAASGEEAIKLYKKQKPFDFVLMDIRMPDMDGPTTMKKLQKIDPSVKVIAQSAFAQTEEKNKYLNMGFLAYLTKPIDNALLIDTLLCY